MRVLHENPSKEEKESSFFDSFVSIAKDVPKGKWARAEAPDYILRTDKQSYGLEITSLVLNHSRGKHTQAAIRRSQDNSFAIASELAEEHGLPPLEVTAKFRSDTSTVDEVAAGNELFVFVKEKLNKINDSGDKHFRPNELRFFEWIQIVKGTLRGRQWLYHHRWGRLHANWLHIDPIEELQQVIEGKGKRIKEYRKKCDECWLLIGVDEWTAPEAVTLTERGITHKYETKFSRVYFLRNIEQKLYRLV